MPPAISQAVSTEKPRSKPGSAERKGTGHNGGLSPSYSQSGVPDIHRTLPHSLEAEQGVLGSMLISPTDVIGDCVERINEQYFYQPAHATIYTILVEFWTAQRPADVITLTQVLRDRKMLEEVGGAGLHHAPVHVHSRRRQTRVTTSRSSVRNTCCDKSSLPAPKPLRALTTNRAR